MATGDQIPITKNMLLAHMSEEDYESFCEKIKICLEKEYGPTKRFWIMAEKGEDLTGT
jgi:hypothetical protein